VKERVGVNLFLAAAMMGAANVVSEQNPACVIDGTAYKYFIEDGYGGVYDWMTVHPEVTGSLATVASWFEGASKVTGFDGQGNVVGEWDRGGVADCVNSWQGGVEAVPEEIGVEEVEASKVVEVEAGHQAAPGDVVDTSEWQIEEERQEKSFGEVVLSVGRVFGNLIYYVWILNELLKNFGGGEEDE